jgi:hypothetical protein
MNIKKYITFDKEISKNANLFGYSLIVALVIYNLFYFFSFSPKNTGEESVGIFLIAIVFIIFLYYVVRQNILFAIWIAFSVYFYIMIEQKISKSKLRLIGQMLLIAISHFTLYQIYQSFYSIKI